MKIRPLGTEFFQTVG